MPDEPALSQSAPRREPIDAPGISLADPAVFARQWEAVQALHADLPGEDGAARRAGAYAPYFLRFGKQVFIAPGCRFHHPQRIVLEDDVRINEQALLYGSGGVRIGRHARIGPRFFVHSANHDIAPSPEAFHERGYQYDSVVIGDNCLVSANVSIMPGVTLGTGSFVAAAAVVTAGAYKDGARLAGVPARRFGQDAPPVPAVPAPALVILGRARDPRTEALRRIVATLGLAQVVVHEVDDDREVVLPGETRGVLRLDAALPVRDEQITVWSLAAGEPVEAPVERESAAFQLETNVGDRFDLPADRLTRIMPVRGDGCDASSAATLTLHHAMKRLRKRRYEAAEQVDLLLAISVLSGEALPPDLRTLRAHLMTLLTHEGENTSESEVEQGLSEALAALRMGGPPGMPVAGAIFARMSAGSAIRQRAVKQTKLDFNTRVLAACPELLPALAMLEPREDRDRTLEHAEELARTGERAWIPACVAAMARLRGDRALFELAADRLLGEAFFDPNVGCVRSSIAPGTGGTGGGWSYAALLGVILALRAREMFPERVIEVQRETMQPLRFGVFRDEEDAPVRMAGHGALVSSSERLVSAGLVDNWITAMTPPVIVDGQFEIAPETYAPIVPALERAWRAFFRFALHEAGESFIEILPWPSGYRGALSLRYDVDRAVTGAQALRIVEIQQRFLKGPCAGWYAIPGTPHGRHVETTLRRHMQEIGVHGVSASHAEVRGQGVTMHSAPASEYWRGRCTLDGHARAGAAYTEMMSTPMDRPQPAWLPDESGFPAASDLWMTPLHFPLEGSTRDADLAYFDRLRDRFLATIARGGHVIIGSHPDLNQHLLIELIERRELADLWCTNPRDVVERCRRLLSPGAVTMVRVEDDDRPRLLARESTADVVVRIEARDQPARLHTLQLVAGQPRPLDVASTAADGERTSSSSTIRPAASPRP